MTDTHSKPRRAAAVPSSRFFSRHGQPDRPGRRVAGNLVTEGSKQWMQGRRPALSELLLSRKNLEQVADKLARMRGAAMKLGQTDLHGLRGAVATGTGSGTGAAA